jgi:hypothetical protein
MSRPWLAAGAVLVVLLGTWFALDRLGDSTGGAQVAKPVTATTAEPSPEPSPEPSAAPPPVPASATGGSAEPSATSSATSSGTRPRWYPLELFDDPRPTLILATGGLPADDAVFEAGHAPNGPFWDGVAQWLIRTRLPQLTLRVEYNSEAGMFCAYGDRSALEQLGTAMAEIANSPDRVGALVAEAEAAGFFFDD